MPTINHEDNAIDNSFFISSPFLEPCQITVRFLQKLLTASSRWLFSQKAPPQIFDWVQNTPLYYFAQNFLYDSLIIQLLNHFFKKTLINLLNATVAII